MASLQSLSLREPLQRVPSCASLDRAPITSAIGSEQEQKTCAICIEALAVGSRCAELHCGGKHQYHTDCIDKWLTTQSTCPICRDVVLAGEGPGGMPQVMQWIQNNDSKHLLEWIRTSQISPEEKERLCVQIIQTAAARETDTFEIVRGRRHYDEHHAGLVRQILEANPNISGPSLTRSLRITMIHNGSMELLGVLRTRGSFWQKIIYNPFVKVLYNFIVFVLSLVALVLYFSMVLIPLLSLCVDFWKNDLGRAGDEVDLHGVSLAPLQYSLENNSNLKYYKYVQIE